MKSMTSRQRLLAAIEGREVDVIPTSPRIWRYGMWKGLTGLELARKLDFDFFEFEAGRLPTPFDDMLCQKAGPLLKQAAIEVEPRRQGDKTVATRIFRTPDGTLRDVVVKADPGGFYGMNPHQEWIEPLVKQPGDTELLTWLLPPPECIRPLSAQARRFQEQLGEEGLVAICPSIGVDEMVVDAFGVAAAMIASLEEPALFDRAVDVVNRWQLDVLKLVLEDGWKIIFEAWYNFSLSVGWSPEFHRRKVAPLIRQHADLIHSYGGRLFFYDDGRQALTIGQTIDAGADIIQTITPPPAGDLDYAWLARNYGGQACFNGGVDTVKIRFARPEEIAADTRAVLEILAPTGRFILGTSDSITENTPDANIAAFFTTARAHGREMAKKLYG